LAQRLNSPFLPSPPLAIYELSIQPMAAGVPQGKGSFSSKVGRCSNQQRLRMLDPLCVCGNKCTLLVLPPCMERERERERVKKGKEEFPRISGKFLPGSWEKSPRVSVSGISMNLGLVGRFMASAEVHLGVLE